MNGQGQSMDTIHDKKKVPESHTYVVLPIFFRKVRKIQIFPPARCAH